MTLKYNEDGHPYEDPMEENKKLKNRIKELDNSLTSALEINDTYQRDNKKLNEQVREAEGETNSPEMRGAQARIKELESKCREAGRAMLELNAKYEMSIQEIDRLSEENTNIKTMTKGTDGRRTDNNS